MSANANILKLQQRGLLQNVFPEDKLVMVHSAGTVAAVADCDCLWAGSEVKAGLENGFEKT